MIRKRGLPSIVWILLGLLAVSALVMALGNHDLDTNPSTAYYGPSGSAALRELLDREGIPTKVDLRSQPELGAHDIVVCFVIPQNRTDESSDEDKIEKAIDDHLKSGGRVVGFGIPSNFAGASKSALKLGETRVENSMFGTKYKLLGAQPIEDTWLSDYIDDENTVAVGLWSTLDKKQCVWLTQVGKGKLMYTDFGLVATNRYLDRSDNAAFVDSLIQSLYRPGDRVVFTEASFGNAVNPGLLETIGAWALAAWRQLLLIFAVIVYSLGKRFGFPSETRSVQRGDRDLVDAIGRTMLRGKNTNAALASAHHRLDRRLRQDLRLPADASEGELYRLIPENVRKDLHDVDVAQYQDDVRPKQALQLIQKAEASVDVFLEEHRLARV